LAAAEVDMKKSEEGYGQALVDFHEGRGGYEICERDDGLVGISAGPHMYFTQHKDWPSYVRQALRFARGRVLDIGCGAGRFCLYLQDKGHEVTGIDLSTLAIKVCRSRGVKDAKVMSITRITGKLGTFDTIIMLGNNFGLFGSRERAKRLLRRFHKMTSDDARIIAESNDPYGTTLKCHREYQKFNRSRGRMSGQLRIRIRYLTHKTPWFDYLLVSEREMADIVKGTGWHISRTLNSEGSVYIAVMEKD
jgi:SAM-dependent methyltransferase